MIKIVDSVLNSVTDPRITTSDESRKLKIIFSVLFSLCVIFALVSTLNMDPIILTHDDKIDVLKNQLISIKQDTDLDSVFFEIMMKMFKPRSSQAYSHTGSYGSCFNVDQILCWDDDESQSMSMNITDYTTLKYIYLSWTQLCSCWLIKVPITHLLTLEFLTGSNWKVLSEITVRNVTISRVGVVSIMSNNNIQFSPFGFNKMILSVSQPAFSTMTKVVTSDLILVEFNKSINDHLIDVLKTKNAITFSTVNPSFLDKLSNFGGILSLSSLFVILMVRILGQLKWFRDDDIAVQIESVTLSNPSTTELEILKERGMTIHK